MEFATINAVWIFFFFFFKKRGLEKNPKSQKNPPNNPKLQKERGSSSRSGEGIFLEVRSAKSLEELRHSPVRAAARPFCSSRWKRRARPGGCGWTQLPGPARGAGRACAGGASARAQRVRRPGPPQRCRRCVWAAAGPGGCGRRAVPGPRCPARHGASPARHGPGGGARSPARSAPREPQEPGQVRAARPLPGEGQRRRPRPRGFREPAVFQSLSGQCYNERMLCLFLQRSSCLFYFFPPPICESSSAVSHK